MSPDHPTAAHPPADVLRDFNLGRLADEDAIAVGTHLDACPDCCRALRELPARDDFVERLCSSGVSGTVEGGVPASLRRLGEYLLIREIGRGGMGIVYEAEQQSLRRRVALKVLPARALTRAAALERFRRESRLAARLHHTNIVPVFEVGQEGDVCFYAMQLILGRSLDRLAGGRSPRSSLRTNGRSRSGVRSVTDPAASATTLPGGSTAAPAGDRLRPDEVARIGLQAAQALAHAHERGVLHRDVKPSNLLLDDSDTVWVTDFGLAKGEDEGLTGTADFLGTLRYMAPERFKGACDARADVYGLGCTLYELLALRPAFRAADPAETVEQICRGEAAPLHGADVPADLEAVVLKAMDRDPARRYQTAAELADDLGRFLAGLPTRARPARPGERLLKWARRDPAVASLTAAVAAALLVGVAVSAYFALQARGQANDAQAAEARAVASENAARRQSAGLLFDRGLALARQDRAAEGLHWMLAALETSPDPDFQTLVRTHLRGWGARVPVLRHWLDTRHGHAALSPDGARLATAGATGTGPEPRLATVQFWDLRSGLPEGEPLATGDLHVQGPSFSPDGRALVTVSGWAQQYQGRPGWATRWDAVGLRGLGKLEGHRGATAGAVWSRDGSRLLTFAQDSTARLWDAATGAAVGEPLAHPDWPAAVALSPDGRTAVVASERAVQPWDVTTGRRLGEPKSGAKYLASAAFSPDGRTLLLAGGLGGSPRYVRAHRWDLGRSAFVGEARSVAYVTSRPAFLADGRVTPHDPAFVARDGSRFVQVTDGVQVWDCPRSLSRPAHDLLSVTASGGPRDRLIDACVFTADGSRLWTFGPSRWAQAWDTATGRPVGVPVIGGRMTASPDGRLVATAPPSILGVRAPVRIWDAATGRAVCPPLPQHNLVLAMAFRPDSRVLATGGHYHTADLWDVTTGRRVVPALGQGDMVLDLAFSPDGGTLAVGTWGREARLWDATTGRLRVPPLPHPSEVHRVRFSPDGSRLVTMCVGESQLWDARTGERVGAPMPHAPPQVGQAPRLKALFSPDGKVLLICGGDGSFRFWDVATTQALRPLISPNDSPPACFAFSPDSRLVVSGHDGGTTQVWDVASARPLGAPVVQAATVAGVAFRPDGAVYFTAAADGTLRSWPIPDPIEGDTSRLAHALRLATGLRIDAGQSVTPLSRREWDEERRRWRAAEGEADWALSVSAAEADWHDARARDAEQVGAGFTARWHLERLAALRPGDWLPYARRGAAFTDEGNWESAEREYRLAAEHGSGDGLLEWFRHRAWVCGVRKQWTTALRYLDRLIEARPAEWRLYLQRAEVHGRLGAGAARDADADKAVSLGADAEALMELADERGSRGDWARAAELFARAARSGPLPAETAYRRALASVQTGDAAAYRRTCAEALAGTGEMLLHRDVNAIIWSCTLAPGAVPDYGPVVELARRAAEVPPGAVKHAALNTLGALLYRAGRFREAAEQLAASVAEHGDGGTMHDWVFLAMTHYRLGDDKAARGWLDRTRDARRAEGPAAAWSNLEVELLRREAESLLDSD